MNKKCNRQKTFYTKDVLPPLLVQNVNNELLDMDEAVINQTLIVQRCENKLKEKQKVLIDYINQLLEMKRFDEISILDKLFVSSILKKVKTEENSLRNKLIGQQETVEMLKKAVSNNEVEDAFLAKERTKRNCLTSCLSNIVKQREVVFSALEVLQRMDVKNNNSQSFILTSLKKEFEDLEAVRFSEDKKLQNFTEWQRNPSLMLKKQTKEENIKKM